MSAAGSMSGAIINLETLVVRIVADTTHFDRGIDRIEGRLNRMASSMTSIFNVMAAGIAGAAIKQFASFDEAITRTMIKLDVSDARSRRFIESRILQMGRGTTIPQTELVQAVGVLGSSGRTIAQSLDELSEIQKFAVGTGTELSVATRLLIETQQALGMRSQDANKDLENQVRIMNTLAKASTLAEGSTREFLQSFFGKSGLGSGAVSGSVFRRAGMDIEDVAAHLISMQRAGIKGSEAGTVLTRTILSLQQSAVRNSEAWKALGLKEFDKAGKQLPLSNVLEQLQARFKGMSDLGQQQILNLLGGTGASTTSGALNALLGNIDQYRAIRKELVGLGGVYQHMADMELASFSSQFKILTNNLREAAIVIGSILAPGMRQLNNAIREALNWWNNLNSGIREVIVTTAAIYIGMGTLSVILGSMPRLLWAVFGPLRMVYGLLRQMFTVFMMMFSWTGLLIVAVGAAVAIIVQMTVGWDKAIAKMEEAGRAVAGFLYNFKTNWPILRDWLATEWANLLTDMLGLLKAFATNGFDIFWAFAKGVGGPIYKWLNQEWEHIWHDMTLFTLTITSDLVEGMVNQFEVLIAWLSRPETWAGLGRVLGTVMILNASLFLRMLKGMGEAIGDWAYIQDKKIRAALGGEEVDPMKEMRERIDKQITAEKKRHDELVGQMENKDINIGALKEDWTKRGKRPGEEKIMEDLNHEKALIIGAILASSHEIDELQRRKREVFISGPTAFGQDVLNDLKKQQDAVKGAAAGGLGNALADTLKNTIEKVVKDIRDFKPQTKFDAKRLWDDIQKSIADEMKNAPDIMAGFKSAVTKWPKFLTDLPVENFDKFLDKLIPGLEKMEDMKVPDIVYPLDKSKAGYEFKQMDLKQMILQGQFGSNPAAIRRPQEVHAPGVEKKLDQLRKDITNKPLIGR